VNLTPKSDLSSKIARLSSLIAVYLAALLMSTHSVQAGQEVIEGGDPIYGDKKISEWVAQLSTPPETQMILAALVLKEAAVKRAPGPLPAVFRPALPLLKLFVEAHGPDSLGLEYEKALRAFGHDAIPQYAELMQGRTYVIRAMAAHGLAAILKTDPAPQGVNRAALMQAVPIVVEMVTKADGLPGPLLVAFATILTAGGAAASAEVVRGLESPRPDQRLFFASVLGDMGPAAKDALPAVTRSMQDPHEGVRRAAAMASSRITGTKIICNDDIIKVVKLGVSTIQLVSAMEKAVTNCTYDVSKAGLERLRSENVPDEVVQRMIGIASGQR